MKKVVSSRCPKSLQQHLNSDKSVILFKVSVCFIWLAVIKLLRKHQLVHQRMTKGVAKLASMSREYNFKTCPRGPVDISLTLHFGKGSCKIKTLILCV